LAKVRDAYLTQNLQAELFGENLSFFWNIDNLRSREDYMDPSLRFGISERRHRVTPPTVSLAKDGNLSTEIL
jgi:hypothetical protein